MQNAKCKMLRTKRKVESVCDADSCYCQKSEEVVQRLSSLFASANRDDRLRNTLILLFILHKMICKGFNLYKYQIIIKASKTTIHSSISSI